MSCSRMSATSKVPSSIGMNSTSMYARAGNTRTIAAAMKTKPMSAASVPASSVRG